MTHFSNLPDYMDYNELSQCFIDYLIMYTNNTSSDNVYCALEELLELADRQWHTYELLDNEIKKQLTNYLKTVMDFDDKKIMHYILRIIPCLGMEELFSYIVNNKSFIQNLDVLHEVRLSEKEYGKTVNNPYSGME
jgi:hypothetical protein